MFALRDERKARALAGDLARAMRRRYGAEAEAVCHDALARDELIGVRRRITTLALQILSDLTSKPGARVGGGPLGAA